jgi:hypothetical protein
MNLWRRISEIELHLQPEPLNITVWLTGRPAYPAILLSPVIGVVMATLLIGAVRNSP